MWVFLAGKRCKPIRLLTSHSVARDCNQHDAKSRKKHTSTGVDCPKGTQTIDVICSGVPSHKELHECCDVTKPFLVVEQMEYDCGISRL